MTSPQQPGGGWSDDHRASARYSLVTVRRAGSGRLSLDEVSYRCGLHPQVVRQFVALSLVEADRDESGRLWFDSSAPAAIARAQRLRTGLGLNYAAIGLVLDLLDRIEQLEAALRRRGHTGKEQTPWT
ncbi:chaperone modulator CbpM [Actinospica sp.]|jgi:DNA-binding transcriptional MerR regulator|uniref:chaperone modulator CbpM n=1 Tax=Actinospica sp. TaxID=1872142 RepID=UPI002C838297|nr:chaperone modulator CbpM [Actinospica sp.]HWG27151.1 chaperone modulator CbpM [Actinospica sp.]